MTQKAYKYRLYPSPDQQGFLSNHFGAARFVYNYFLNHRKEEYLNNKKTLNYYDDAKHLTELKKQENYSWLYQINAQTLQASLRHLETAYQNFFMKRAAFPKFHSKKNKQTIKIPQFFTIENNLLYIPKLKTGIRINLHQSLPDKQISCYISKTSTNKYYVSFVCEVEIERLKKTDKMVGIDVGIKTLVVASDGLAVDNPKFYRKAEKELQYQQKQLSKKEKGSHNREKQRREVAKRHEKIANQRRNFTHQLSRKLINENQVIIAENLSIKNMVKNHCLAKSISDAGWGELIRQLSYKSEWYGRTFYQIDRFFPSSKTCNGCHFIVEELPLNIREWDCPYCSQKNDRDLNAALNIRDKGIKDLDLSGYGIYSDIKQKLAEAFS